MSNTIQDRSKARAEQRLTAYVHVSCHVQASTEITYTLRPENDRLWVDVGDGAGEVTLFLDRAGLICMIATLTRAAGQLDEQVAALKHPVVA